MAANRKTVDLVVEGDDSHFDENAIQIAIISGIREEMLKVIQQKVCESVDLQEYFVRKEIEFQERYINVLGLPNEALNNQNEVVGFHRSQLNREERDIELNNANNRLNGLRIQLNNLRRRLEKVCENMNLERLEQLRIFNPVRTDYNQEPKKVTSSWIWKIQKICELMVKTRNEMEVSFWCKEIETIMEKMDTVEKPGALELILKMSSQTLETSSCLTDLLDSIYASEEMKNQIRTEKWAPSISLAEISSSKLTVSESPVLTRTTSERNFNSTVHSENSGIKEVDIKMLEEKMRKEFEEKLRVQASNLKEEYERRMQEEEDKKRKRNDLEEEQNRRNEEEKSRRELERIETEHRKRMKEEEERRKKEEERQRIKEEEMKLKRLEEKHTKRMMEEEEKVKRLIEEENRRIREEIMKREAEERAQLEAENANVLLMALEAYKQAHQCTFLGNAVIFKNGQPGNTYSQRVFDGKLIGLYFSGNWCPPSRDFTPLLKNFHDKVRNNFEVLFISSDQNKQEMMFYLQHFHGDWMYLEFECWHAKTLETNLGVNAIPKLVIVKPSGETISDQGVSEVMANIQNPMALVNHWSSQ